MTTAATARKPVQAFHELTATGIVAAIRSGHATCEAVARSCLEHIASREPAVQAWQYLDPDQVIARARALDAGSRRGTLIGVPIGVKDIVDTADMPTEYGSPIYRGHRPRNDAACVALARKAGGLMMGKTVTTEFANRFPGKTRNPFDPERTPGGSSSGSAAAVGDRMVPLAIGTQTTASTLRPASFCGVFGYRPTYGDLRCAGVKEASGSLDTLGLFARSVEDIALFRDALLASETAPLPSGETPPRIGFCRTHLWPLVEAPTRKLLEDAAQRLAQAGARVDELGLPGDFEQIEDAHRWISSFEFARNFTWEIENHEALLSDMLRNGRIKDGLSCSFERYAHAREVAARCRALLDSLFGDYDILLTAAATGEAPLGLASTGNTALCAIWTTMHVPALSVPVFRGPHGLPIGAQLIGRRGRDRELLSAARWVHRTLT